MIVKFPPNIAFNSLQSIWKLAKGSSIKNILFQL